MRIWVSACATGEEAYTLAMLAIETCGVDVPVRILATDIASNAIAAARAGDYSSRSVRRVPSALRALHFSSAGARHLIREPLKSMVEFRRHNLVTEPSPPPGEAPFDLVVCRNLLIYFSSETSQRVVASLESALSPGGMLILGAADRLTANTTKLAGTSSARKPGELTAVGGVPRKLRRPLGLERGDKPDSGSPKRTRLLPQEGEGPPGPAHVRRSRLR